MTAVGWILLDTAKKKLYTHFSTIDTKHLLPPTRSTHHCIAPALAGSRANS